MRTITTNILAAGAAALLWAATSVAANAFYMGYANGDPGHGTSIRNSTTARRRRMKVRLLRLPVMRHCITADISIVEGHRAWRAAADEPR